MKLRRSRLTDDQTERLLEHFVAGTPARAAAALVGVNRNTARLFYHRLRGIIAQELALASPQEGQVAPVAGILASASPRKGARRAAARAPIFGLFERDGKVHTVLMRDAPPGSSPSASEARVRLDAVVYADSRTDRGVFDVSSFRHQRVDEAKRLARGKPQIDSIESFWSQAKRHLRRYNGIPRHHFHLFLRECEWRFNYGSPAQLLKVLKAWMKTSSG